MTLRLINTTRRQQSDYELLGRWQRIFEITHDFDTRSYYCRVLRIGLFKITKLPEPGQWIGQEHCRGFLFVVKFYLPWVRVSRWR